MAVRVHGVHKLPSNKAKSQSANDQKNSLTDPSWELIDPTPDVHALFEAFNQRFFSGQIVAVSVQWGRFLSDAGRTLFRAKGWMWECQIFLSAPLLKLRPRADLINTLLHEMIHAFLFVTFNNKDRSDHGPEFHKHMYRINADAGTHITVYHDFHDEVNHYRQHWWRCNGPCQRWKPRFGMLCRAINRAPGPQDRWWGEHARGCGGTFIKVKEPPKPEPKRTKSESKSNPNSAAADIRKYFPTSKSPPKVTPTSSKSKASNTHTTAKLIDNNIRTIKDVDTVPKIPKPANVMQGAGKVLGGRKVDPKKLRDKWLQKFDPDFGKRRHSESDVPSKVTKNHVGPLKKTKLNDTSSKVPKVNERNISRHSNDTEFHNLNHAARKPLSDTAQNIVPVGTQCPACQKMISTERLNEHLDECLTKEHYRQCIVCEEIVSLCYFESHVAKCVDTLDVKWCGSCEQSVPEDQYEEHVEQCLTALLDDLDAKYKDNEMTECVACGKQISRSELDEHLEDCNGMSKIFEVPEPEEGDSGSSSDKSICPICIKVISQDLINDHVDKCLDSSEDLSHK
ncbi:unnamed protein product [Acanthoscelides obtectus]|uniref:Protein with SprT-like domain at the N terminus n=1 Tax=Acanthoscelides obtectus TaxID=200917 RepID=A0A9P0PGF0_ACAOB|nr:unnamed protein product [Acanthoscelides obtectus]CAK1657785.1 SprT-like domain-containing protein Spartan [Acanthoscelides obtectus]